MIGEHRRLWQLLELVGREAFHLQGVVDRLFVSDAIDADWAEGITTTPEGIDRLESFVGKFSRMQDTTMDKLLPAFLTAIGERNGTVLDNLNRAEKLGFVSDADAWLAMRMLRNRLVHEYVEDPAELAAALTKARDLVPELKQCYEAIQHYARKHIPDHTSTK
ncbi:hypothetical protein [Thauera linaloolentis]|uniref:DUF86 domain-containing protein n=1 Tax=Thauera linaloolentis (strain DSM 12138 / JCM 21573 / CCUG 41526 / CIP 105981 / IAM 15112 / NBRC 102519 / 47Lol) TaxID=1123367 RepID=N6ZB35_THAL4|nr:hypothetical protein [Thauera linaloolentis]ENO89379.1 hypothetical protein C666_06265 [Thauera linaloolentis 47Lol = DSM 12138]MCM8564397.1 hypothetical protein [Thauera linaloolentis]